MKMIIMHFMIMTVLILVYMLIIHKNEDAYTQIFNSLHHENENENENDKLYKQKIDKQLEIENEIKRLEQYLEKIKKYKKEDLFKQEIKNTEELIEAYRKMLNV